MKLGKRDRILYSVAIVLQIIAFFVYPAIEKKLDPFGVVTDPLVLMYPLILSAIISGVVGFASDFRLKGLYPLAATLMFVVSVAVVFGSGQITNAFDFAAFCVPHIVLDYFGFLVGVIGRWYGMNKRKYADR